MRHRLCTLGMLIGLVSAGSAASSFTQDLEEVFLGLDFQTVWAERDAILAAHPNDPLAYALVGRAHLEGAATPDLAEALRCCGYGVAMAGDEWKRAECQLGLALARWAQGDTPGALVACDATAHLSPRSRARNEADLVRALIPMSNVATPHLWVFAPSDSAVARDLTAWADRREQAAEHIIAALGVTPWRRIRIVACDDQAQGEAVLGHGLGTTDRPMAVVYTRADQTPGHELTHAMSLFLLPGHPWGGGPDRDVGRGRLINEGLAVALDDSGRDLAGEARDALNALGHAPTFAEMDQESTPEPTLYPLAGAFIDWLGRTRGGGAVVALWRHPGTNEEAAQAVFGVGLEALWAEWLGTLD